MSGLKGGGFRACDRTLDGGVETIASDSRVVVGSESGKICIDNHAGETDIIADLVRWYA